MKQIWCKPLWLLKIGGILKMPPIQKNTNLTHYYIFRSCSVCADRSGLDFRNLHLPENGCNHHLRFQPQRNFGNLRSSTKRT